MRSRFFFRKLQKWVGEIKESFWLPSKQVFSIDSELVHLLNLVQSCPLSRREHHVSIVLLLYSLLNWSLCLRNAFFPLDADLGKFKVNLFSLYRRSPTHKFWLFKIDLLAFSRCRYDEETVSRSTANRRSTFMGTDYHTELFLRHRRLRTCFLFWTGVV